MKKITRHAMQYCNIYLLFGFAFLFFGAGPMQEFFDIPRRYFEYLFLLILLFSSLLHKASSFTIKITSLLFLGIVIQYLFFSTAASYFVFTAKIVIVLLAIKELIQEIKKTQIIDINILSAALNCYLLIGIFFAYLFSILNALDANAFLINAPNAYMSISNHPDDYTQLDFIYYSFVTLTTLGYGDILPNSLTAKLWSVTEAIVGVLFLAVMIGRTVSLLGKKR